MNVYFRTSAFDIFSIQLRGEKLNYNSCTSLLLRKSQNLLFLAPEVQWALKVYPDDWAVC